MMPDESNDVGKHSKNVTKVYKRRWLILVIFISYAVANSFQWVEYSIVTNIIAKYYNVDSLAVDWTSIIYLIIYPIIVIPASFIIDNQGLKVTALIGGIGTALAAIIKVFSIRQDLFYVILIGQAFGSTAQVFILCLPPKIAAVWFKPSELSFANSLGVFGSQLGLGLGFLVPSVLVKNSNDVNDIGNDLRRLCWLLTIYMLPALAAIVFFFPKQPPLPPSIAQIESRMLAKPTFKEFCIGFINIMKKPGMALQMTAYGLTIGCYTTFTTFLNQFVLQYFENRQEDAGRMGILSIVSGIIGIIIFGIYLDKTHQYKKSNLFACFMSAASLLGMMVSLKFQSLILTYLTCILVGFFLNSYIAIGMEFAVELTFPSDESTATGILTAMSQGVGVITTWGMGPLNKKFGALWGMGLLTVIFLIAFLLTQAVPNIKNRQDRLRRNKIDDESAMKLKSVA